MYLKRVLYFLCSVTVVALVSCSSNPASNGSTPVTTIFGDELSLTGYSLAAKDGHTEVELRWKAVRKPGADYMVFVHALDSGGGIVYQFDHALKNSSGSESGSWRQGETASDRFAVTPPEGQLPGAHTLRIGLYIPKPMKVLHLNNSSLPEPVDGWKGRAIIIENVECK